MLFLSLGNIITKYLFTNYGYSNINVINFYRGLIWIILSSICIYSQKLDLNLKTNFTKEFFALYVLRVVFGIGGFTFLMLALNNMRMSSGIAIMYLLPIVTTFLGILILKEPLQRKLVIALITSLCSSVLIIKPEFLGFESKEADSSQSQDSLIGLVYCFLFICSASIAHTLNKKIAHGINPLVNIFGMGVAFILSSQLNIVIFVEDMQFENKAIFLLVCLVGLVFFIAQLLMQLAAKLATLTFVQPFEYTMLIYGFLFGIIFFQEKVNFLDILGAVGIALSTLISLL